MQKPLTVTAANFSVSHCFNIKFSLKLQLKLLNIFQLQLQLTAHYLSVVNKFKLQVILTGITLFTPRTHFAD